MTRSWSIHEVARLSGSTSRTLRHYDAIGLLPPSSIAPNGYRRYDQAALVRLQRVLLLRQLGLGLPAIAAMLDDEVDEMRALGTHLARLREEQARLARQIASVETTLAAVREGRQLMPTEMFDGFDHTRYRDEVIDRWGADAYALSDASYRGRTDAEKTAFRADAAALARAWMDAAASGVPSDGESAQALAARHVAWLRSMPGTPSATGDDEAGYLRGLGDLYVADDRFAANYGGVEGARFVRDALTCWVDANLARE